MWILQELKKIALWNKRHLEGKGNGECAACLKHSVSTFVELIYKTQRLEISCAVRHIFIYLYTYIYIYKLLTLIPLTCTIWWTPTNASKWRMGFNSAFKGLISCAVMCLCVCACVCVYIYIYIHLENWSGGGVFGRRTGHKKGDGYLHGQSSPQFSSIVV